MPVGETIAIGTELLLGEIQDSNTATIARRFRDAGIDLFRTMIVGDNPERIAQAIREALTRSDIVITTGGLGPTVDDPTRLAVAAAFETQLEYRPDLWDQIQERFNRFQRRATENNRRQAYIPEGATVIDNPVGTAPAFYMQKDNKLVISLPGVPREMEHILQHEVMPLLGERYQLKGIIKAFVLHTAGVGESQVDEWIGELENNPNPSVGLVAHPGQVDIRVAAKAGSEEEADALIAEMVSQVQKLVGVAIFGSNQETLEQVVLSRLTLLNWQLSLAECGLGGAVAERLSRSGFNPAHAQVLPELCQPEDLQRLTQDQHTKTLTQVTLGAGLYPGPVKQDLYLYLITPNSTVEAIRSYGGPPAHGPTWAVQTALDFVRRNIP
ncbi:MAG TPA: CinA family nicotinamide mononucleotide deamidase-related protein [Bellilinea sp.]|nr:CinA family nicotinamide mononucleotide deamidase-related protein [Bellilinea sp.]